METKNSEKKKFPNQSMIRSLRYQTFVFIEEVVVTLLLLVDIIVVAPFFSLSSMTILLAGNCWKRHITYIKMDFLSGYSERRSKIGEVLFNWKCIKKIQSLIRSNWTNDIRHCYYCLLTSYYAMDLSEYHSSPRRPWQYLIIEGNNFFIRFLWPFIGNCRLEFLLAHVRKKRLFCQRV